MNLSKWIIGASLIIGIIGFIGLGYNVVWANGRNETAMYIFSGLFVAIGSAIAILIDVEPKNPRPSENDAKGMFNTLGNTISFADNSRKSNNLIGFGYAISYLLIGVLIVYKLISNDENKNEEFLATLASGFVGLMLAVIGKYAFVKEGSSFSQKATFVILIFLLPMFACGQDPIEFDLNNINAKTEYNAKSSIRLIISSIDHKNTIVKVTQDKNNYIATQPFDNKDIKENKDLTKLICIINLTNAAFTDVTITVIRLDNNKPIDTTTYDLRVYKEKYWDVTLSAGLFATQIRSKRYEWESLNQNYLISNLDTSGLFKVTESNRNSNHVGLNTLSHVLYQITPSLGLGFYAGLGVSFTENVVPQMQFGVSAALLKDKRVLINLGLSSAYGNSRLSPFISRTSTYSHVAVKQITLDDHIGKGFGKLGPTLSVTYQITN